MNNNLFNYHIKDWTKTLIVGMGNRIKRDDGVGIEIAENLMAEGITNVIMAENSIENYIGKINSSGAEQILMIDAVDQNEDPGFFQLIPLEKIENTTTNTHNLSLDTIASFLAVKDILVLAIQPGDVSFGFGLTNQLIEASALITKQFTNSILKSQIPTYS